MGNAVTSCPDFSYNLDDVKKLFSNLGIFKNIAFYVFDATGGKFLHLSCSIENITGYPSKKFIQEGCEDFLITSIHPLDFLSDHEDGIYYNISSGIENKVITHEFRFRHPVSDWIWLESISAHFESEDRLHFILGILQDITTRKEKENFLWAELEKREKNFCELENLIAAYKDISDEKGNSKRKCPDFVYLLKKQKDKLLSEREQEVLQLIANGFSSKQLADKLNISNHTVISHRKNLLEKFKVKNTAELIKEASKSFWLG